MARYTVEDESGNGYYSDDAFIKVFDCVSDFETDDLLGGCYKPGAYYIRDNETGEREQIVNQY